MQDLNSQPKATTHFCYEHRKSTLPTTPAVHMVTWAPEEEEGEEGVTPQPSEDSDSGESYEASPEESGVSAGNIGVAMQVVRTAETFPGQCFRCNKVGHRFSDKECKMCDLECLNSARGPAKTNKGWQAPRTKGQIKTVGMKAA